MTTGYRWGSRALWALAACAWLAVLPAMASDVAVMARKGVADFGCMVTPWQAHLNRLEGSVMALAAYGSDRADRGVSANEKGGPASAGPPNSKPVVVNLVQAADRLPADILPLRLSRSSS
jgi:hypothetical protein